MAKDDQNKDREEDDFFGDDEDFGLPELEYEALDDDDEGGKQTAKDEASDDDFKETEFSDESGEDFSDMDDAFGDGNLDDDIPDQIDDAELEAELEAEMSAESPSASEEVEEEDLYEEESFDDFGGSLDEEIEDDGEEIPDSVFDSDVLDEDEFKQFEKELMETEQGELGDFGDLDSFDDSDDDEYGPVTSGYEGGSSKGKFARVVIIGVIVFSALGTLFYKLAPNFSGDKKAVAENSEAKTPAKQPEKKQEETQQPEKSETKVEQKPAQNTGQVAQKPAQTKPATTSNQRPATTKPKTTPVTQNPGEITSLTERTNSFYIVIASFVDGDLAMDHSKDLAAAGKSPYIIPPFGKAITYRVAIRGFGTLAQAQGAIDGLKPEYGQDIWILKY